MPELPDIEYIAGQLCPAITGLTIKSIVVKQPVVIRMLVSSPYKTLLPGKKIISVRRHGPFLVLAADGPEIIIHFMLAGTISLEKVSKKKVKFLCMTLVLEDDLCVHLSDRRLMIKIYITNKDDYDRIPGFSTQGPDILGADFSREYFLGAIEKRRCQARVFLMDQTAISAIGNAYADEILYHAGLNPRKKITDLTGEEKDRLYESIKKVIDWGIQAVSKAGKPLSQKVRDHMKVRGREGEPCPVCNTPIRTVAVHGFDSYYCPVCQPLPADYFIQWK